MNPRLALVIPTYNERKNIGTLIPLVFEHLPTAKILIVDDSSPDGTSDEVRRLQKSYPRLALTVRKEKNGLGSAYIHGFKQLRADKEIDWVISMDADGSHHPRYVLDFFKHMPTHDLIIGSRYVKGGGIKNWEWYRYMLSFFGNLYMRIMLRLPIRDITAGFNCYKKSILDGLTFDFIRTNGYAFQIDMKAYFVKKGLKIKEVPIIFAGRTEGESKISSTIIIEGLAYPFQWLRKKRNK